MAGPSVIVLPQWQGSVRPQARQLVSGAARLAALARDMGAQVLEPGGFSAGRSPLRDGVDSFDVLLAAHARAIQVLPDGPLLAIGGDCGADLGPAARALRRHDGELAIVWIDAHADGATIEQVLGLLETIDRALPVTSAFVGEPLGGDEPDTAAVAPLLEQLLACLQVA